MDPANLGGGGATGNPGFQWADILAQGGPVVVVIGVASVVALAVFLLRWWTLGAGRVLPRALRVQVRDLVLRESVQEALTLCRVHDSPLGRVYLAALQHAGKPREQVKEFVTEVGRHEALALQQGIGVIDTVAVVSPLLGLLGTVWGMIQLFSVMQSQGVGNAMALAGGIGTALYTTLAGLTVAIPCRVAHSALLGRLERVVLQMEEAALDLLDLIAADGAAAEAGRGGAAPSSPGPLSPPA
jgi:biopolymer transport protein ExbB